MKIPQNSWIAILLFISTAIPSFATVVINAPSNGSTVRSPFSLSAYTSLCSGQQVAATGYSLDNSSNDTVFKAPAITTSVWAPAGGHTLHVKAWGVSGATASLTLRSLWATRLQFLPIPQASAASRHLVDGTQFMTVEHPGIQTAGRL